MIGVVEWRIVEPERRVEEPFTVLRLAIERKAAPEVSPIASPEKIEAADVVRPPQHDVGHLA